MCVCVCVVCCLGVLFSYEVLITVSRVFWKDFQQALQCFGGFQRHFGALRRYYMEFGLTVV